jgi:hypothetical protein
MQSTAMKKTLRESLVDYDMALLRALAEMRGALLTSNHQVTAADELAAQLVSPASVAIARADLSPAEAGALAELQAAGGWMEAPRFVRRYGASRPMGPGRLERERPWLAPANPAEGLWYRGFIFKGFRQTESGVVEVIYLPSDLLALLPAAPAAKPAFALAPAAEPHDVQPAGGDLVEDVFNLLVYVRNHDVAPGTGDMLRLKDLQAVNALCVSPVPAAAAADDDRLALVVRLGRAAGLMSMAQEQLAPHLPPDRQREGAGLALSAERVRGRPRTFLRTDRWKVRDWLQATPAGRLAGLQAAWRDDPDWNDLWHVPTLRPQPTGGWKNDPLLARRKVLGFLAGCQPAKWYRLDDFVAAVKAADPDFQRPDGDYTTWYLHDLRGQPLMGFEHWDEVEGALLRRLVAGPLHWLGVVDLGRDEESGPPVAFRLAGDDTLTPVPSPKGRGEQAPLRAMTVDDTCTVRVPSDASLYDRFQLARFADLVQRGADGVTYRISPASLARARRQGISAEQVSSFLARVAGQTLPPKAAEAIQRWHKRSGAIRLERGVILRVDAPETLAALRRQPALAPLLGEVLGPQAVLVPPANIQQVRRWLVEQGYMEEKPPP